MAATTPRLDRRRVLGALVGAGLALPALSACSDDGGSDDASPTTAAPGSSGATAAPGSGADGSGCTLTPEVTEGPYHLDGAKVRRDITEGKPGVPFDLRIEVVDAASCTPVADAAVDIWHCDASGEYSGFEGNGSGGPGGGTNDDRFLRGIQLTDRAGVARFSTIFPGWYQGRTVHIHVKVVEGGTAGSTYEGGHVAHTGQIFFTEDDTAALLATDAYVDQDRGGARTTNEQDGIAQQAGPTSVLRGLRRSGSGDGVRVAGTIRLAIDPDATPAPAGMAGPGGGA